MVSSVLQRIYSNTSLLNFRHLFLLEYHLKYLHFGIILALLNILFKFVCRLRTYRKIKILDIYIVIAASDMHSLARHVTYVTYKKISLITVYIEAILSMINDNSGTQKDNSTIFSILRQPQIKIFLDDVSSEFPVLQDGIIRHLKIDVCFIYA